MSLLELLGLQRPLLIFDTETTGPEPANDRIVEIGFLRIMPDGTTKEWQSFINPGIPIPKEATFGNGTDAYPGHGITDAMVQGCRRCYEAGHVGVTQDTHDSYTQDEPHDFIPWPFFSQMADNFLIGFSHTDFAGFNVKRFDLPLMKAEFARNGKEWSYDDAHILDGFRIWQLGEGRSLSDAVEAFLQRKHEGAHRALDDVQATAEVLIAQLTRFIRLPRTLPALHEKCWPKDPNAIDPDGKIIWKDGEAVMNFGKNWKGKPLKLMIRKDLAWIASPACSGANSAVKQICRDAMAGKFPEPTLKEIVDES